MSGRLADLTGPGVTKALSTESVVLLPVGAIEQHGPHLPLSVDAVIADETASALLETLGDEVDLWVLPTLSVSKSNEHAWSAGTLWLSAGTMLQVLDDLASCVATTTARRLVFLNGHGGNTSLLATACRDVRVSHDLLTFLIHSWIPPGAGGPSAEEEMGMGVHGGLHETSVFAHLRPGQVDMERVVRRVPEWLAENRWVRFGGAVQFGWTSRDFGPDGHIGDPTGANPELGQELFEKTVEVLADQLREIAHFDYPR